MKKDKTNKNIDKEINRNKKEIDKTIQKAIDEVMSKHKIFKKVK